MAGLRPHFWLLETTSWGEPVRCDNCERFGQDDQDGQCGRSGWVCGIWEEAENVQIDFFHKERRRGTQGT